MLRKRSRATSEQALMADYGSSPSPTENYRKPTSPIFLSPRLFTGFAPKGLSNTTESVLSPTSILDTKHFSGLRNPFLSNTHTTKSTKPEVRSQWEKLDSRGVGLGIVDQLTDEMSEPKLSKPKSRMVLFGSQLKIQIPSLPSSALNPAIESPNSPADFGIKTVKKSPFGSANSGLENRNSLRIFTGRLSASEMELSEDYTCVISYGPNPKTTHIFDDCVVESCCGIVGISAKRNGNGFSGNRSMSYPSESFLSFCYNCNKNLGHGKDIYMYRGEKAFCSSECRQKEMTLEEEGGGKMEF